MPKKRKSKKSPIKRTKKRQQKRSFVSKVTSLTFRTKLLFITGLLLIIAPILFYTNETIQLAFFTPQVPVIVKKEPTPVYVVIPKIRIALPIREEAITNGAWGIADDGISHLNTSARPNEKGPIILYGHNTNDRFGPIRWLSVGDKILITTQDKKQHTYTITKTEDVSPSEVNLLTAVKGETVVLYTCDGFADLQRFLVFASPRK